MPPRTRSRRLSSSDGGLLGVLGALDAGSNNTTKKNANNTNSKVKSKPVAAAVTSAAPRVTAKPVAKKTIGNVTKNPTKAGETLNVHKRPQRTAAKKASANAKAQPQLDVEQKETVLDSPASGGLDRATDQHPITESNKNKVDASVTRTSVKKADTKLTKSKTSCVQEPTALNESVAEQSDATHPTPPRNPPSKVLYTSTQAFSSPNDGSVLSGLSFDESLCHTANMLPCNSHTLRQDASRQRRVDSHHDDVDVYAPIVPMTIFPEDDLSGDGGDEFSKQCDEEEESHVQGDHDESGSRSSKEYDDTVNEGSSSGSADDDESTQEQEFASDLDEEEEEEEVLLDDAADSDNFIVDSDEESDFEEDYVSESDEDEDLEVDSDEEEEQRRQNHKVEARTNKKTNNNSSGHTAAAKTKKKSTVVLLERDEEERAVSEKKSDAMAGETRASVGKSGLGSETDIVNHLEPSQHDDAPQNDESQPFDDEERSVQTEEGDETEDEESASDTVNYSNGDDEVEVIAEILEDTRIGDDVFDVVVVAECCDGEDDDARSNDHLLSLGIQINEHDSTADEYESSFDDDGEETLAFDMPDDVTGNATVPAEKVVPMSVRFDSDTPIGKDVRTTPPEYKSPLNNAEEIHVCDLPDDDDDFVPSSVNDESEAAPVADEKGVSTIAALDSDTSINSDAVPSSTGRKSSNKTKSGYDCSEDASQQSRHEIGDSLSQAKTRTAESDAFVGESSKALDIEHRDNFLVVSQTKMNQAGGYHDGFVDHFRALALKDDQDIALECDKSISADELTSLAERSVLGTDQANTLQEQVVSQSNAQGSSHKKGAVDESFFVMGQTLAVQDEVELYEGQLSYSSYSEADDITDESILAIDAEESSGVTEALEGQPRALSIAADATIDEECLDATYDSISPISENLENAGDYNSEISSISQTLRHDTTTCLPDTARRTSSDPVIDSDSELNRKQSKQSTERKVVSREGSVRRGKWSLGSKIGTGSFGVVHVGMNTHTGQLMAVKSVELSPAAMKDIRVEVEVLKSLSHVNIVRYLGAERNAQKLHIFQEWVPGGSVTTLLNKFGPFSAAVIRSYLSQILTGLTYLHENRILHRDIKGGNVLVSDDGIVKLADFGSAKRMAHQQSDMMESLTMRGTPYFMAPEVFEEHYNGKADIWSVGCVAFQMATGSPPWKREGFSNPMSLFLHLQNTEGLPSLEWPESGPMRESEKTPFQEMLKRCFWRKAPQRPTAQGLAADSFFSGASSSEDDASQTLFSVAGDSVSTFAPQTPGAKGTPPLSRLPRRSPFISPPLPRRIGIISSVNVSPLDRSPKLVSKDWPSWARDQLKKEVTSPGLSQHAPRATSLMDSLAYSADTTTSISNPFARSTVGSGREPSLAGLQFVDGSLR